MEEGIFKGYTSDDARAAGWEKITTEGGREGGIMNSDQDTIIRVYTALSSLRKNIGSMKLGIVSDTYINEYHNVLEKLKNIHIEVTDFYIPNSLRKDYEFHPGEKYVERTFFLTKIDAVLGYFEIIMSPEQKKIGFRKPEEY